MTTARLVPKEQLAVLHTGSRAPVWWGMVLLVTIESVVFATFLSSYFYLRFSVPEWPPAGIPPPDLLLPTINTGVLISSGIAVFIGSSAIKKGNVRRLKWGLGIGLLLEIVFLAIKIIMSLDVEYAWDEHAYASIYHTIDRLHTGHVVAAVIMGSVALVLALRGYFTRERRIGVQVVNLYWQFVAVVWIAVYLVLFFVPRWF